MFSIGSVLLSQPKRKYVKQSYSYYEWELPTDKVDDKEKVLLVKKKFLTPYDTIMIWIDLFSDAFPEKVIEDARRIAFDLRIEGCLNNLNHSFHAMVCLYISSWFHNFDFKGVLDDVLRLRSEGRDMFGIKRKIRTTGKSNIPRMLKKFSQVAMDMMPEKLENLYKMHNKMEGLDGKEVDNLQGN